MPLDCNDAAQGGFPTGFPGAQSVGDLQPTLSVNPWPCGGYDGTYDFAFDSPASVATWDVEMDLGIGALFGNPFVFPGFPPGVSGVTFEGLVGAKAHVFLDVYFGINPGASVTVTFTLTETGGALRTYQNYLNISDAP